MCPGASPCPPLPPLDYFDNLFVLFESPSQPHSNCWYKLSLSLILNAVKSTKVSWALDRVLWSWTTWKKSPSQGFQSLQTTLSFVRPFATSLQVKFLAHFLLSALNLKVNLTLTWHLEWPKKYGWDQNNLVEKLSCCPIILLWQPTFHSHSSGNSWLHLSLSKWI